MMKTIKKGDIDRLIWGHRLYDEQTGIMTLLEFLSVLESKTFAQHNPNREISSETLKLGDYKIPKRTVLRTLVFTRFTQVEKIHGNDGLIVFQQMIKMLSLILMVHIRQ